MVGYIYEIKFSNGKRYIGQTDKMEKRKKDHYISMRYKKSKVYHYPLYRAMRKYPDYEINYIEVPIHELDHWEIYYIDVFQTFPPIKGFGYNQTVGGGGVRGYKHSEEECKRRSIKEKKKRKYPGAITKFGSKFQAKGESPETVYIGMYFTREKAIEACWTFYNTGVRLPGDRLKWKGCIQKTKSNTYVFRFYVNRKRRNKTYKTREQAEAAQKKWIETRDVNLVLKK